MTDHGRAMLHLRQITKRFGSQTVLQGIDLDLRAGEFVCASSAASRRPSSGRC
jgi:ABC-type sugar transport system ATPase subunit